MSMHVLVVEDHPAIRTELVDLLKEAGYQVTWAKDSADAIDRLSRLPRPCILLWDPMIPRVSLSLVEKALMVGVHVATIPVSVTPSARPANGVASQKELASSVAVLRIVEEHCPPPAAVSG
jgi:CheY-like chemotaxis protein